VADDEVGAGVDLGRVLRGLRRRADLSQRQLAARAGVPQATIARIEASTVRDPAWRTVERLVRAMGADVVVTTEGGRPPVPEVPHDHRRDAAGRRYPAHLDAVPLLRPERWWGAWWATSMARSRWPLHEVPEVTFDLSRPRRDERRRRQALGAAALIRRVGGSAGWCYVAEEADGDRVGELSGHPFSAECDGDLLAPGASAAPGMVVLDGVFVRPQWRGRGVGRRLVEALLADVPGPVTAMAFSYRHRGFLAACGFTETRCLVPPRWFARSGL
jgi:transcriptional regulator with XRE-family HTH domain